MRWGKECFVYFAQAVHGGPIKIGQSVLPQTRVRTIQADLPFDMVEIGRFPGGIFREAFVHNYFRKYHIRAEWFEPSPELWRWALCARTQGELEWIPDEPPQNYSASMAGIKWRLPSPPVDEIARMMASTPANVKAILGHQATTNRSFLAAVAVLRQQKGLPMDWAAIQAWPPGNGVDAPALPEAAE